MACLFCLCSLASVFLVLFVLFDVFYYVRIVTTVLFGRLFQKKKKVTEPTTIYGLCFTQDLDLVMRHMNNARFVRDLDFARFHFFDRTGIFDQMLKNKSDAVQAATNIRYRRVIPIFTPYRIETQMVYWDERSLYLEQKFITNDGFIRAVVLSKQTLIKPVMEQIMSTLEAGEKPTPQPDLDLWLKSMDASSQKLKADKAAHTD